MGDIRITPIEPDRFYHIYNRGVNGEVIFKSERNKHFFLEKISTLLLPVCEIWCYCLLNNHFHLLVRIRSDKELVDFSKQTKSKVIEHTKGLHSANNIFPKQFSRIFNSYSQAFNKENNRHGALIESPFRRKVITSEDYLRNTIIYIHQNPEMHRLTNDFRKFRFSSYQTIISSRETALARKEVIELFDDVENFIFCHNRLIDESDFE